MLTDAPYRLKNEAEIASPALIYYPDMIRENTRLTIEMAGGADRLWPHVKSHKTAELIQMQIEMGITRFKCATLSELELTASCGAAHVLLAYPLLGPNIQRFLDDLERFPETEIYALGDSLAALERLEQAAAARQLRVKWFADVNLGMDRTGVPVDALQEFCRAAHKLAHLACVGLHCYDGQNHQSDANEREAAVEAQMRPVFAAREQLRAAGIPVPMVIAGGSPTFPCHAREEGVFLSPGTVFLWDWGYYESYRDLPFMPAAALLTRVVSHPAPGVFTLDLGCKAIAADPAGQRGVLLGVPGAEPMFQSEEHWTWRMRPDAAAKRPEIGRELYVIPTHICPTTALYRAVRTARNGEAAGEWVVAARNRD